MRKPSWTMLSLRRRRLEDRLQELMQQFEGQKSKRKAAVLDEAILNSPVPAAAAVLSSVEAESEQGACSDGPDFCKAVILDV